MTLHPLQSTTPDFWRLVYDYGCTSIVMLNQLNQSNSAWVRASPAGRAGCPLPRAPMGSRARLKFGLDRSSATYLLSDLQQVMLPRRACVSLSAGLEKNSCFLLNTCCVSGTVLCTYGL